MQEFDFPLDLDIKSFLVFLICYLIVVVVVSWLGGYFYKVKDPYGRDDLQVGVKRANLWAKVSGGIGVFIVVFTCLMWEDCFNRLDLYPNGTVKVWFGHANVKVMTIDNAEIDSIHYGVRKGCLDCYVRIQLKNGKSYKSTFGYQCKDAFHALKRVSNTKGDRVESSIYSKGLH